MTELRDVLVCPYDGSTLSRQYDWWLCERGDILSPYVLACWMNGEQPRAFDSNEPLKRV